MLSYLGADIIKKKNTIFLNSPIFLKPKDISVPGDFSSAAFVIVAALITKNSRVILKNVGLNFKNRIFRSFKENECKNYN